MKITSDDNRFLKVMRIEKLPVFESTEEELTESEVDAITSGLMVGDEGDPENGTALMVGKYEAHIEALRRALRQSKADSLRLQKKSDRLSMALVSGIAISILLLFVAHEAGWRP